MPHTNLYRLNGTSDSSHAGLAKSIKMYENLLNYMEGLENDSINLVFDRTFFTEEVYCRLGYKEYKFTEEYNKLLDRLSKMDFDIKYITLYLEDTSLFEKRLNREGKADVKYAKFDVTNSINQQNTYLQMAEEIKVKYPQINVINIATDRDFEEVKKDILDIMS
ncbi:MAG: hypothetical protein IJ809_05765 [Clostridia bacterium]|nr:hypothetical protein [Clostridia bacterium]